MADLTARGAVPSAAIRARYQKSLTALVEEMNASVVYWLKARYRAREDEIVVAQDRSPSRDLEAELRALLRQWSRRFDEYAESRARWFSRRVNANTTTQLFNSLKSAGLTVQFKNSRRVNNMLQAIIAENVGLIKSIPQQFLGQVRSIVMTGVTNGRDMAYIADEIQERYKVSRKRAVTIARDQTNKATEAISTARCQEVGITRGIWMHRSGSKQPRRSHVDMEGRSFVLSEGLYDRAVGRKVKPGELVNCFPGESQLNGFPFAEKLYRRFYSGKLTEVVTHNGTIFSVTPNHPILTLKGWKRAGLLNEGDYILQARNDSALIRELNQQGAVLTFKEFFDTLVLSGISPTILDGSTSQFHGDGANSEVDVIDINRLLANVSNAQIIQKGSEFGFTGTDVSAIASLLSGQRPTQEFFATINGSPESIISGLRDRLPIFLRSLSIAELISLAHVADCNLRHEQTSSNNLPAAPEMIGNGLFALSGLIHGFDSIMGDDGPIARALWNGNNHSALPKITAESAGVAPHDFCRSLNSISCGYEFSRVVKKRISEFSAHVFNLQTCLGWYIAEKTISHNCRCTFRLDISTVAPGVAMDGRMRSRLELPGAIIEWGKAA